MEETTNGAQSIDWYKDIPGVMAVATRLDDAAEHRHHALQLVVARGGSFILSRGGAEDSLDYALVGSNEAHACRDGGRPCLSLFVEPESELGRLLAGDDRGCRFFVETLSALKDGAAKPPGGAGGGAGGGYAPPGGEAAGRVAALLERFALCDVGLGGPHTAAAKGYIDRNLAKGLRVDEIARAAGLSLSRVQHVFKADMGISLKRYMLWRKLAAAVDAVHAGLSVTDAAFEGGFADAAHFTRTCRDMLGLAPSLLAR